MESFDLGRMAAWLMVTSLFVVGCANGGGPSSGGNTDTLDGDASTVTTPLGPTDCGNLGNPCCAGRCEGELSCLEDGRCGEPLICGAQGEPCCADTPACFAGLACTAERCQLPSETPCGERGQACCDGPSPCGTGLGCQSGTCLVTMSGDAGTPPPPDSGAPPPPPPPPADPCADAFDCLDCTSRPTCGYCDGVCVESDFLGPPGCFYYAWFSFECAF
jgi:hypothetical protein